MEITIDRVWLKVVVLLAALVVCYLFIDNNPEVQQSIRATLRTFYLIA